MKSWTILAAALAVLPATPALAASGAVLPPFRILITNDDGIASEGIAALVAALRPFASVTVSAPAENFSGAGQSITIFSKPVRVDTRQVGGVDGYAVYGTPADSAIFGLLRSGAATPPFDLVISGINKGENVGGAAYVSGTVGAARQAVMMGVPAIAISQQYSRGAYDFSVAARYTAQVAKILHAQGARAPRLVSINVPNGIPKGVRLAPAKGMPFAMNGLEPAGAIDGAPAYRLKLGMSPDAPKGSDTEALNAGYITVSVLGLDPNAPPAEMRLLPPAIMALPQ